VGFPVIGLVALLGIALILQGLGSQGVLAQGVEPTGFKDVTLSILPEYDDGLELGVPTVLVMLEGEIEGVTAPAEVRFLVPSSAGMYSAGSGPRESYVVGGSLARTESSVLGWDELSFVLQSNYFVLEYYTPIQTSADKAFSVQFRPLYSITSLTTLVLEPFESSEFVVDPSWNETYVDGWGYTTHLYTYDGIGAEEIQTFDISYHKSNPDPSETIAGRGPSLTGDGSSIEWPLLLVLILTGGIPAGLFLYWIIVRRPSKRRGGKGGKKSKKARRREKTAAGNGGASRFCAECGKKLNGAARFCPNCGAKL
jgi:hypothetical protein